MYQFTIQIKEANGNVREEVIEEFEEVWIKWNKEIKKVTIEQITDTTFVFYDKNKRWELPHKHASFKAS